MQLPVSCKTVRLYFILSSVFIAMSYAQLHGWQKPVTDFNSPPPTPGRFVMSFFPQDLLKRQSNKYLNLLLLIRCVIKAEKFNVTFYVCSVLSGGKLETMNYIVVYMWKEYKRRNYAFKNTYHILGILYFKYIF